MNKYDELLPVILDSIKNLLSEGKTVLPSERALSETCKVSRQTIRRILSQLEAEHIIEKKPCSGSHLTGYLPGRFSDTVVIMTSDSDDYDMPEFLYELEKEIRISGLKLKTKIMNHKGSFKNEAEILEALQHSLPLVLIVEPVSDLLSTPNLSHYLYLLDKDVRIIFKGKGYRNLPSSDRLCCIYNDYRKAGYLAAKMLSDNNHSQIGGIIYTNTSAGLDFFDGITAALTENGIPYDDTFFLLINKNSLPADFSNYFNEYFKEYFKKPSTAIPSAFIIQDDKTAAAFYKSAKKHGYQIPDDISVITFGDSYLRKALDINLTEFFPSKTEILSAFILTIKKAAATISLTDIVLQPKYIKGNSFHRIY